MIGGLIDASQSVASSAIFFLWFKLNHMANIKSFQSLLQTKKGISETWLDQALLHLLPTLNPQIVFMWGAKLFKYDIYLNRMLPQIFQRFSSIPQVPQGKSEAWLISCHCRHCRVLV